MSRYTLEILHHNGVVAYPNKNTNNMMVQTQDIEQARLSNNKMKMEILRATIRRDDPSVASVKLLDTKKRRK